MQAVTQRSTPALEQTPNFPEKPASACPRPEAAKGSQPPEHKGPTLSTHCSNYSTLLWTPVISFQAQKDPRHEKRTAHASKYQQEKLIFVSFILVWKKTRDLWISFRQEDSTCEQSGGW